MTAVAEPEDTVIELSAENIAASVQNALRRLGCTFDQLAEQARTGEFPSLQVRLAWIGIGGFYRNLGAEGL